MGTYTANYQLYMPTVGEQGWGELINGNYQTIDTTMAGLNTRLTAVESEVNGNLSCTSVTTSGKVTANGGVGTTSLTTSSTITSTGLITANGGVKGNLTGNVTGQINVSTNANSGDLTLFVVSFNNPSLSAARPTSTRSVTGNVGSVSKKNTAILNYTGSTNVTSTCTITITYQGDSSCNGHSSGKTTLTVKDNTSNSTILTQDMTQTLYYSNPGYGKYTKTYTFNRNSTHTYTITLSPVSANNNHTLALTMSTPNVTKYLPV